MENVFSLAVSLLTLIVVTRFIAFVFGGGSQAEGDSQPEASNHPMTALEVDHYKVPGFPGRLNSPLERSRYYRAHGHDANGMELRHMSSRTLAIAFVLVVSSWLPQPGVTAELAAVPALTSVANGTITLSATQYSPLFAEFDRSSTLSQRLHESLLAMGFVLTPDRAAAKATLIFRGDLALAGGPVFYKGVKVPIGDATEKALQEAKDSAGLSRAEAVQAVAGLAINKVGLETALTPFWQGMALAGMATAIGDATGIKGRFNAALTGDPRGICLNRCEDWKKVNQTVYLSITLQEAAAKQEVRVMTRTFSETVAPQAVLDRALVDGVNAIKMVDAAAGGPK